jgi:hypothetical protein
MKRSPRSSIAIRLVVFAFAALALPICATSASEAALLGPLAELQGVPSASFAEFREFGRNVALSADGHTALIGTPGKGAWVFDRVGDSWVQDGPPLGGANAVQEALGCSVAVSGDGKTLLVGAPGAGSAGAAWIFTRSAAGWQGIELTPAEAIPSRKSEVLCEPYYGGGFGTAVALSADGSTAIVGATRDGVLSSHEADRERGGHVGGAWVFARSGSTWVQQGPRLSAGDEVGEGEFGDALALSSDGSTALIGAPRDARRYPSESSYFGAAWFFTRAAGRWAQQGSKIIAHDAGGGAMFGASVALSADADTALIGGPDESAGAVWPYTHTGSRWTQQGPTLTPSEQFYSGRFGQSLALSSDGDTAVVGGVRSGGDMTNSPSDGPGAVWTLARFGDTWVREEPKRTGARLFGWDVAASADAATVLIGDPSEYSGAGAAFATELASPPANSFSIGSLTIGRGGTLTQQLSVSAAGDYRVRVTVSVCALAIGRARAHERGCARRRVLYGAGAVTTTGPGVPVLRIAPRPRVRKAIAARRTLGLTLTATDVLQSGPMPPPQTDTVVFYAREGGGY